MTPVIDLAVRRRWKAPAEHGSALLEPLPSAASGLLSKNSRLIREFDCDLQGRSFASLISDARRGLVEKACRYTSSYRDVEFAFPTVGTQIVMAGHQPLLFHSGVWFKNFVLSALAKNNCAQAINLLIDNDTVSQASIRVPTGSVTAPRIESVQFDLSTNAMPLEQRRLCDIDMMKSFDERVRGAISPLIRDPLVTELWKPIDRVVSETPNLGQCLARLRHKLEGAVGLKTLELPLSHVCEAPPFQWFVSHLLAHLPCFWEIHNALLAEYRQINRVRSRTHPVPELTTDDDWLEAPFWVWSDEEPVRQRLFARSFRDEVQLRWGSDRLANLPLSEHRDANRSVDCLQQLAGQGVKIRPRALITTMYARLFLSDLFVHGIGGAKYDELTDSIAARFFGLRPPEFVTATATAKLPLPMLQVSDNDLRFIDRKLRDVRFHPETFVNLNGADGQTVALISEKNQWLGKNFPGVNQKQRHDSICRINEELQATIAKKHRELAEERTKIMGQLKIQQILGSREFSFCLFPKETLLPCLLELSEGET